MNKIIVLKNNEIFGVSGGVCWCRVEKIVECDDDRYDTCLVYSHVETLNRIYDKKLKKERLPTDEDCKEYCCARKWRTGWYLSEDCSERYDKDTKFKKCKY